MNRKKWVVLGIPFAILGGIALFYNTGIRASTESIQRKIEKKIIVGMKFDDVIKAIQNEKLGNPMINRHGGFYDPRKRGWTGNQSITVNMGSYRILFAIDVILKIGFDSTGAVSQVFVEKQMDAM